MIKILLRIGTFFLNAFFPVKKTKDETTIKYTGAAGFNDLNLCCEMSKLYLHDNILYTLEYRNELVKRTIWLFKYYLNKNALRACTYILYDQLIADVSDRINKLPFRVPHALIHCPSSTYFRGDKSFDHMKELVLLLDSFQSVDDPFFICCSHAVLPKQEVTSGISKNEHTPQHLGTRRQRFEWSKKRFIISPTFEKYIERGAQEDLPTTHIYCIDDVVTTGASMEAISNILEQKFDVQVMKFCICH